MKILRFLAAQALDRLPFLIVLPNRFSRRSFCERAFVGGDGAPFDQMIREAN